MGERTAATTSALRGLPIKEGRRRAIELLEGRGHGDWAKRPIRTLSKGMAQTVQLLGTIVHRPRLTAATARRTSRGEAYDDGVGHLVDDHEQHRPEAEPQRVAASPA